MNCHYGISLTITAFDSLKVEAIKAATQTEWDFDDFTHGHEQLYAFGEAALNFGTEEEVFAKRLATAIFEANDGPCEVQIDATYLESPPTETFFFGYANYYDMTKERSKNDEFNSSRTSSPQRDCQPRQVFAIRPHRRRTAAS